MVSIDYSISLVTGRKQLPPGKDYFESLEESLQGGVTLVLVREKEADTAEFIEIAAKSKEICDRYNVPILINDRVDVAIAINAHGVHVGQSDMPVPLARKLMPKGTIIGLSCNTPDEVRGAVRDNADYIAIGAVWPTQTKKMTTPYVGVRGVGAMLEVLDGTHLKALAIGGINSTNLLRTLHGSVSSTNRNLDGVFMITGIVAEPQPRQVVQNIGRIFKSFRAHHNSPPPARLASPANHLVDRAAALMISAREVNPLVHQITNNVAATHSANVTLAIGGSPIMASEPQEMEDISRISNSLLINIGGLRADFVEGMEIAGRSANANCKPVIFDPVRVSASAFRQKKVNDLLNIFQASVIKGNASELAVLAKSKDGVAYGTQDPAQFVKALANEERCVIVMTGPVDYISDGTSTVAVSNGHERLTQIAGAGCVVGSCIATYCGTTYMHSEKEDGGEVAHGDMFLGAVTGVLVFTVAAQLLESRPDIKGPGTLLPALIDELCNLQPGTLQSLASVEFFP